MNASPPEEEAGLEGVEKAMTAAPFSLEEAEREEGGEAV
jgi:hypothetical protein